MKKITMVLTILILLGLPATGLAQQIAFLIIDADSYLVNKAINSLELPAKITVKFFTHADISTDQSAQRFIEHSQTIIVDVMMKELSTYLIENVNISQKRIYAIRKSRDDEGLQKAGFIFDPAIYEYFSNLSVNNIRNL
ncbi:hypothetical protein C6A37_02270, partial [Desulfobacteraceae bacterium SEEP-SAG9]